MINTQTDRRKTCPHAWVDPILEKKSMASSQFGFPVPQTVKNLPAVRETGIPSLGQKDPLEKKMAILSSILPWRISRTEEPGGL